MSMPPGRRTVKSREEVRCFRNSPPSRTSPEKQIAPFGQSGGGGTAFPRGAVSTCPAEAAAIPNSTQRNHLLPFVYDLLPFKPGWPLVEEGTDPFLVILAVIDLAAHALDAFECFGRQRKR